MHLNSISKFKFFKLVYQFSPYRPLITDHRSPVLPPTTDHRLPITSSSTDHQSPGPHRFPFLRTLPILILTALVLITVTANTSHADAKKIKASEYQIKAAYLYNFLLFTRWPAPITGEDSGPGGDTVIIGIVGEDPFGAFFNEVEGRTVKIGASNKNLIIRRFGPYSNTADLTACRLLFVSASEKSHLDKILAKVRGAPVLTVGDSDNFLKSGGMIKLVKVKDKIRWEINRGPVASAELRLDSMLLKSAAKVIGGRSR